MPLIYRRDLNRPLTFEEMDGNLEYLDRYAEDVEIVVAHIDEISTVATSINGVNAVAGSLPSVITTALHVDNIDTVAGDVTNIDAVAGISSEVTAVAGVATEIAAVYADLANIDAVAGDLTNIDALAAVSTDISTVASIEADVTTVAGISSDVSTLSAISDDILTVSSINGNVTTVANNSANITTVATNIAAILAAQGYAEDAADSAGEAAASALEALGYLNSTEAVYLNFDERYLGSKATPPVEDNQGNPLIVGAMYFDTTIRFMYIYNGSEWQSIAAAGGVDSVNGQTGDVVLDYEDVGAYSTSQVDTLLSAKADDSAVVHDTGTESVAGVKTFTDGIISSSVQLSGGTGTQGRLSWNADEETADLIQDGATLQLGQELQVHCRNNTGSNIGNAVVVMATGTIGMSGRITIAPWDGTTDIKYILGVSTEIIEAGTDGKVTTFGKVRDVDTGAISGTLTTGVIYAKTDGTGGLTYTKPATNAMPLAFLVSAESAGPANNGTIMVRVTPVSETTLDHAETAYGWGNHASAGYATAANLSAHTGNTSNPHSVTATQVGLGNVTNESKATMFTSPTFTGNAALGTPASGNFSTGTFTWPTFNQNTSGNAATATYATSAGDASTLGSHSSTYFATASDLSSHTGNTSNPHSTTAAQVGAYTTSATDTLLAAKQATLVSGTNIKTINGSDLLGSGNLVVGGNLSTHIDQSALFSGYQTTLALPDISVMVGGTLVAITAQTVNLATSGNWDSATYATAANRNGKDFYVYALQAGGFILSANSSYPTGYNAGNSRKIGGFHCLCVAVGTISGHTLTGYAVGDILPRSVWDRFNRSSARQEGTVLSSSGVWVDIYLPSVSGATLVSVNGGTIADGASYPAFHCYKFEQWFARQGMKSISQLEFFAASQGANQSTNISGSSDPGTTSGHTDTAGRRMISNEGIEDLCGVLWQWTRDQGGNMTAASWANAYDGNDSGVGGQHYQAPYRGVLGGGWNDGVVCGSRCSIWYDSPLILKSIISGRGVAEPANSRF